MNGLVLIFILFFFNCVVNEGNDLSSSSTPSSESVAIKRERDEIRKVKKRFNKERARRYTGESNYDSRATFNRATDAMGVILKTYFIRPFHHGKFLEPTIRSYRMFQLDDGKFVFGTLLGDLDQSFKSLMKGRPRTGDIISCRIPKSRMAEHYMMVINNKIAEVGVEGGKTTHKGYISFGSYKNSSYFNSTECLYHENRVISRAEQIDERNGDDTESDLRYSQIVNRFNCTVNGNEAGNFHYDLIYCNCQDLVLYWAYGYMETNCLVDFFNGCSTYLTETVSQIAGYVDESGFLKQKANEKGSPISSVIKALTHDPIL